MIHFMVVNEITITESIKIAKIRLVQLGKEKEKVLEIIERLESIRMIPDPKDSKKKNLPEDRLLGTKMNASRRQAIYDKVVDDISTL